MTRRGVLILHAYSAENAGDGLLVRETITLVREALGPVPITLLASHPETFEGLGVSVLSTRPTFSGLSRHTRSVLNRIDEFDLAIAVGGGYLRAGTPVETLKTALIHGPQLRAAARASIPTLYLPQSIGPARFGTRAWLDSQLARLTHVMVRDDRSRREFSASTIERFPDLATAAVTEGSRLGTAPNPRPVLSIRSVRGKINPDIYRLGDALGEYDGYIQSTVGGNDDRPASATLSPREMVTREDLMIAPSESRVVIAVRLHAALMALAAGHYVIHLSYERKGFGAFDDLGLNPWVHNVNTFEPAAVARQAEALLTDADSRADYDARIAEAKSRVSAARRGLVERVAQLGAAT